MGFTICWISDFETRFHYNHQPTEHIYDHRHFIESFFFLEFWYLLKHKIGDECNIKLKFISSVKREMTKTYESSTLESSCLLMMSSTILEGIRTTYQPKETVSLSKLIVCLESIANKFCLIRRSFPALDRNFRIICTWNTKIIITFWSLELSTLIDVVDCSPLSTTDRNSPNPLHVRIMSSAGVIEMEKGLE